MYTLVLLATLTTGASSADFCGLFSKHFNRNSCYGACAGCYGCGGCVGNSCFGRSCFGASCFGCSGCFGSSCAGCNGACYGGSAFVSSYSCHGCYGCYGCYGCAGAATSYGYGSSSPTYGTVPSSGYSEAPVVTTSAKPVTAEPARLVVALPVDAKLYVDGNLTTTADKSVRSFRTPELQVGEQYVYTLKVEVVRGGKTLTESKQVIVTAGNEARAEFDFAAQEVAAK